MQLRHKSGLWGAHSFMEDADLKQKTLYKCKHNVTSADIAQELCPHSGEHRTLSHVGRVRQGTLLEAIPALSRKDEY